MPVINLGFAPIDQFHLPLPWAGLCASNANSTFEMQGTTLHAPLADARAQAFGIDTQRVTNIVEAERTLSATV